MCDSLLRERGSNARPLAYEASEIPLLHPAMFRCQAAGVSTPFAAHFNFDDAKLQHGSSQPV